MKVSVVSLVSLCLDGGKLTAVPSGAFRTLQRFISHSNPEVPLNRLTIRQGPPT